MLQLQNESVSANAACIILKEFAAGNVETNQLILGGTILHVQYNEVSEDFLILKDTPVEVFKVDGDYQELLNFLLNEGIINTTSKLTINLGSFTDPVKPEVK